MDEEEKVTRDLASELFIDAGFKNTVISSAAENIRLRTNVRGERQFHEWKEIYSLVTHSTFIVRRAARETDNNVFSQTLLCQHGSGRHTEKKETKHDTNNS